MPKPTASNRIAIIGPSSSGKSTLAGNLSHMLEAPVLHLDQLAHIPHSNWKRQPSDFIVLEQRKFMLDNERWIIEGNYSVCMPERFDHADTVIWCDPSLAGCIYRYIKRCIEGDKNRAGALDGAKGEFSIELIKFTLNTYPKNKLKYANLIAQAPHLKLLHLKTFKDIKQFKL
ncbi:MAG: adenylate kinase [Micavibrio aeruginosavorus]|uniref:Adenylate kinase n=1 Tax=Micavibrio aeruginosavorus TaxID=349221 RepID=A0A2W5PXB1_9BACT|nr:MAG: adenylate kinase [Micavibrio aeruginosavorus]